MEVLHLDPYKLMIFYYVVLEQGVTKAAKKLCLTQPTITYHLKSLERYAGIKLFNIKYNQLFLTEAGKGLFIYAKDAEANLRNAEKYLKMQSPACIRIEVTPIYYNKAASALAKLWKSYPDTNFILDCDISPYIIQKVSDLELNVGVVLTADYKGYQVRPIRVSGKERLVFIASPEIPISKQSILEWKDLEKYSLILGPKDSLTQKFMNEKFNQAGLTTQPHFVAEKIDFKGVKIFVESGTGIALWNVKDFEEEIAVGKIRVLPVPEDIFVTVDIVVHENIELLLPIKEFITLLRREFKDSNA